MQHQKEIEDNFKKKFLVNNIPVPNLSPESRGNEGMRDFIVKYLPNNPETGNPADWTECRNFNLMLSSHL